MKGEVFIYISQKLTFHSNLMLQVN